MFSATRRTRDQTGGAEREIITLEQFKESSGVTISEDDALIQRLINTATSHTETLTGRCFVPKTVDLVQDAFPGFDETPIILPFPPLISVTSIKYYDDQDVLQTWDSAEYEANTDQEFIGLVYPKRNFSYPATRTFRNSVQIEYIAGYDDTGNNDEADRVPDEIVQAVVLLVAHWYENREATTMGPNFSLQEMPLGYQALISNFTIRAF